MRYLRIALLGLVALASLWWGSGEPLATSFDPDVTLTLPSSEPGSNSIIVTNLCLDYAAGCSLSEDPAYDANFDILVTFTPPEFFVAGDADIVDGAVGAFVTFVRTLGVINGACVPGGLTAQFDMMEATTDILGPTVIFEDDPVDPDDTGEIFEDNDADGLPNGVEMYPDFLLRVFPGSAPKARLYGQTTMIGRNIALNLLTFHPGTTIGGLVTDPALGFPTAVVIQDWGDPQREPAQGNPITDDCTPLKLGITYFGLTHDNPDTVANESGSEYRRNPDADGSFNFLTYVTSRPDADDDSFENSFDTCPYTANHENPRLSGLAADPDSDGIDSACDPDPGDACGPGASDDSLLSDCDGDGYMNRADNCPLVSNGAIADTQADADSDGIGDACDQNIDAVDGHVHVTCVVDTVSVGGGGTPPSLPNVCTEEAVGLDSDGDGFFDSVDGCPSTPTVWPTPVGDEDCDGFATATETFMGTDPLVACAATGRHDGIDNDGDTAIDEPGEGANDEDPDAWPPDADDDQDADVGDILALFLGKIFNPPAYDLRSDPDMDGDIDVGDLLALFMGRIMTNCVP